MEALFGHPILQSLLAGILSWISVSLGASAIFLRREFSRLAMDCMLGAAGGMMLGAAFLGLLQPAAEMASHMGRLHFIPIVCGLMAGAAFLMGLDHLLPHLHIRQKQQEGLSTSWRRSVLLVTAMALHHIPEGLTMGVGYGAVAAGSTLPSGVALEMSSAFMVTGTTLLQNLPEGLVVATALRAEGFSAVRRLFRLYGPHRRHPRRRRLPGGGQPAALCPGCGGRRHGLCGHRRSHPRSQCLRQRQRRHGGLHRRSLPGHELLQPGGLERRESPQAAGVDLRPAGRTSGHAADRNQPNEKGAAPWSRALLLSYAFRQVCPAAGSRT